MVKKIIYVVVGIISLIFGTLGVILPVLPTVPFYLVSAYCFTRGSDKLNEWFAGSRLYKKHLESFKKGEGMELKTKIIILFAASTMLAIAFVLSQSVHLRIFILLLIIVKYYYFIFRIKTIKKEKSYD